MAEKKEDIYFKVNKKGKHVSVFENILRCTAMKLVRFVYPYRVYGNKRVPDGPCVFVGNHYRIWDIIYPGGLTWEGIHFLAKKSLADNKIFGIFCRACKIIAVNRDGNDVRSAITAIKCLKHGDKVSLYPEGTRNKVGAEILPFFSGASMFAVKAKVPIVPVTLYKKPRPFHVCHVIVGDPVELSEFYGVKLTEEVLKEADEKMKRIILNQRYEHAKALEEKRGKR